MLRHALKRPAICLALIAVGCHSGPNASSTASPTAIPVARISVHVAAVTQQRFASQIMLSGTVTSQYSVNVTTDTSGRVTDLLVDVGQSVSQGQPLFHLDTANARRQLAVDHANLDESVARLGMDSPNDEIVPRGEVPTVQKAKSVLDDAYQSYSDYLSLREQELVSDMQLSAQRKDYLSAKADYEDALLQVNQNMAQVRTAQATIAQHQETIAQATVKAPINGFVQERNLSPGDSVQQGQKSGLVIVGGERYVLLDVPQKHLSQISPGRWVDFTSDAFPRRKLRAIVSNISPVANPRSGTVAIRARVGSPSPWLLPGLTVKAKLQTGADQLRLMVPEESVLTVSGRSSVFVVKDATIKAVPVQLGKDSQNRVQVSGALAPGDLVVVSDLPALRNGEAVDIAPR